jgi:glycosyltransferase involved in cell wall biosynthesis
MNKSPNLSGASSRSNIEHLAKHDKPNVLLAHVNDGVTYYRHVLPLKYLSDMGWNVAMSDFTWGEPLRTPKGKPRQGTVIMGSYSEQDMDFLCRHTDILISQRNDLPQYNVNSQLTQALYRLPWVYDTDDNVHAIRPTNAGFYSYNPTSTLPVHSVLAMQQAFAVTVSTENLKEIYGKNNKRIYVLPNGLDMDVWDSIPRGIEHPNEVRISLMLSGAHAEGLYEIEPVVTELVKTYPQVRVYVMGAFKPDLFTKVPKANKHQIVWQEWIAPKDWIEWNKKMAFDIGLAPLLDNDFNRAKSNLRWMEYSAQGIPTIGSDVLPYRCATHGKEILLAKNRADWWDHLVQLVENPELRKEIGTAAYNKVKAEYDMKVLAPLYDQTYKQIIKEFTALYGEPLRFRQLAGANLDTVAAAIDSIADKIVADNTGRPAPKHKPSKITLPTRPVPRPRG